MTIADLIQDLESETLGMSDDSSSIRSNALEAGYYFQQPYSRQWGDLEHRFEILARTWIDDTLFTSSISEMVLHPCYQQIIGMGRDALPFIFDRLIRPTDGGPEYWFWALKSITGVDPVPKSARGDLRRMTWHWLRWAGNQGMLKCLMAS